jgi:hypothetical protein
MQGKAHKSAKVYQSLSRCIVELKEIAPQLTLAVLIAKSNGLF